MATIPVPRVLGCVWLLAASTPLVQASIELRYFRFTPTELRNADTKWLDFDTSLPLTVDFGSAV